MKRSFFALSCWLLAPAAFAILDTNYNGFSDLWERGFNNGSLFDQSFDPHSDDDSDGWTNAQEAGAGTSPFDPNPPDGIIRPDIVHTPDVMGEENGVPYIETPEAVTVTWPTIPGKRYHLLVSPDLSQGSWIEVPDSDFIGNGNIPEFHFTTAESDKLFWRVAVEDIDMDSDGLTNHEEFLVGTNPTLTDTDGDTLSDHAELVAGTDALQADGDGDGWTDAQELAAGTDSSYQDTDGDGIPDSIDTQPLVSALAFADADGDGIPDVNDSNSNDPRGPAPSIASEIASGNPLSNLIEDEIVKFALTVSNPAGAAPTASNLTFFLNGIAETETATITAIGSPVGSSQRFLLTWNAKTTASYPTLSLQNLTLRFRDSQQATSWFMLARIDVAEWEGMVAGLRAGPPSGGWEASIQSHSGGLKSPASYLAGMNGGHALWYRGARNMEIHNNPGPAIFAMIGEGVRYPMVFMSQVGSGPLALHSVADISSAETIPYLGVWAFNDWSESIRISGTGFGCTVPPGGNVYEAIPERTENGNSYVHVEIHRLTADGERMMTDTNWPIYIAQAPARRMTTINFEAGGQGRAKFTAVDCWMPVGAQIAPYTAGTPELPGLPLPVDSHTDSTDSVLLPIAQGAWHKIILKVGPDAAALSNGIGLWLRKGEYGEDAPQTGFTLKVQGENSTLEDLTVPADGKITFAANSQNWQRLTSPEGLTLFMSRDENVDEIHDLSLQLLKKHEWYAQEAVRIASIDLVPVEVNYVDRDVMTNQWAQKKPFASSTDAALFAGPHSGDMVEWRLPDGLFQNQTISWNAKHIASGEITSGPSGVGVNFWRIANEGGNDLEQDEWLKWKPGEYMISCELDGKTMEIHRVRVGYRSDHILVIGQIVPTFSHDLDKPIGGSAGLWASAVADDITSSILPAAVTLDFHDNVALGMGATFLLLPERGAEAWAACWAGALEFPPGWIPSWWPSAWIPPSVAPPAVPMASAGPAFTSYGGKFRPMGSMTARHHYWATQHMLNTNPDSPTVPTAIFTKAAAGTPSLAQVFADKQYRVFHEFQAKFLLTNQGKIEQSTFVPIHNRAAKGTTKLKVLGVNAGDWGTAYASVGVGLPPISVPLPPLDIKSFPDEDSETNLHNEKISHAAAGDEVSSFATARIGEKGRRVSYRQFGKDAPWIFSEIIFHVESDWKVNLKGRTSTTVQWDLLIKPDQSQSVIVSRSPHAPASTPSNSIFNNLNLYARSELDQFILIKDGLLNMEGHLQSFVESGSGAWPEPPIPPTVK